MTFVAMLHICGIASRNFITISMVFLQCSMAVAWLMNLVCCHFSARVYCQRSQVEYIIQRTVSAAKGTRASRVKTLCWYALIFALLALFTFMNCCVLYRCNIHEVIVLEVALPGCVIK